MVDTVKEEENGERQKEEKKDVYHPHKYMKYIEPIQSGHKGFKSDLADRGQAHVPVQEVAFTAVGVLWLNGQQPAF